VYPVRLFGESPTDVRRLARGPSTDIFCDSLALRLLTLNSPRSEPDAKNLPCPICRKLVTWSVESAGGSRFEVQPGYGSEVRHFHPRRNIHCHRTVPMRIGLSRNGTRRLCIGFRHSYRNATIGSTMAARRAGIRLVSRAGGGEPPFPTCEDSGGESKPWI
jgi:hypothetical protein